MISQLIITFLGWLALMVVGANLIGMLVRGLVLTSEVKKLTTKGNDAFKKVVSEFYKPNEEWRVNVVALVLITIYLGVLFYFWNIGVVAVAVLLLVARIPDLLWEMKHGGIGGGREARALALAQPNLLNGKYAAAKNGYGLTYENFQSNKGSGILKRTKLASAVITFAEKNGIDTNNPVDASLLGEFVVAMTREGKTTSGRFKNMPARYMLTLLIMFAALPVLWYALYQL